MMTDDFFLRWITPLIPYQGEDSFKYTSCIPQPYTHLITYRLSTNSPSPSPTNLIIIHIT